MIMVDKKPTINFANVFHYQKCDLRLPVRNTEKNPLP